MPWEYYLKFFFTSHNKLNNIDETYTSPAPGYFNDDDTPDFIFAQNFGAFDIYRYSVLNILDGKYYYFKPKCEQSDELNSLFLNTYGLLVDRSIEDNPLVVFKSGPKVLNYNYTLEDVKQAKTFSTTKFDKESYGSICVILGSYS